jgi:hypothetical protein
MAQSESTAELATCAAADDPAMNTLAARLGFAREQEGDAALVRVAASFVVPVLLFVVQLAACAAERALTVPCEYDL